MEADGAPVLPDPDVKACSAAVALCGGKLRGKELDTMKRLVHVADEVKHPGKRHGPLTVGVSAADDLKVVGVGTQDVLWWRVHRLDTRGLSLRFIGEVNKVPRGVVETFVPADVVWPAGGKHKEIQVTLASRD